MALDPTARESNVRDSIKKFFVDNLYSNSGIAVSFDKSLTTPRIQGVVNVTKWVTIVFGPLEMGTLSDFSLRVYCCVKRDKEGFKLAQLRDTVMGYLRDNSKPDGTRRITLYRSYQSSPWVSIGAMMVQVEMESPQIELADETKTKIIEIRLRWGTII